MDRIGFIGAGQMATALAQGFIAAKLIDSTHVVAYDPLAASSASFRAATSGATISASNRDVIAACEVVFLAVKPQQLTAVLAEVKSAAADKLFVSIAAGITLENLTTGLGTTRVIRVMPNTPALVRAGAAAIALGAGATSDDAARVKQLLGSVGLVVEVEERLLDAVTGLSGSGPAYVYLMIEALADGGVRMGLPRAVALQLAAQTVAGAAQMVLAGDHPAVLKDRVTSPGGTTIAGLQVLEDRGLRGALIAAVEAATKRSKELGG